MQHRATTDDAILSKRENVAEIQSLASQVERLSNAAEFWNKAMFWGLGVAAFAAVFIFITTRLVIMRVSQAREAQSELDKAKDRELQKVLREKDEEIEKERLARVQIEQALAWRSLSPNDEKMLSGRLAHFPEEQFSVWYDAGDAEGAAFAWEIAGVLYKTRLTVYSPAAVGHYPPSGIPFDSTTAALKTGIEVANTDAIGSRRAAEALVQTFTACGFDAVISPKVETGKGQTVWVNIRTRPKGPQGEAKLKLKAQNK